MHHFTKAIFLITLMCPALATTVIAISDNQIDINHKDLQVHLFKNVLEYENGRDSDNNEKVDDINGWNFIHDNNKVFDDGLIGSFDPRVYEYYEVRKKKTLKTASEAELEWYSKIRKDKDFMDSRSDFSSYTHGSHVTCLAMNSQRTPYELTSSNLKFMPIRYLGDDATGLFKKIEFKASNKRTTSSKIAHIRKYMDSYANWMISKFSTTVKYSSRYSRIYHASWGQSWEPAGEMINKLLQEEFKLSEKEVNKKFEEEIESLRSSYMNNLIESGKKVISSNPKILFVFSAGNKKDDTDSMLHYPSSIIAPNVISVGASNESNSDKAYFTNFGKKTVTLFAPGIAIESCSPGDKYVPINGTSQAAPQVTNTAAIIFEMADYYDKPITPNQVKNILTDSAKKLDSLKNLCTSGSTLDAKAAITLARYQLTR